MLSFPKLIMRRIISITFALFAASSSVFSQSPQDSQLVPVIVEETEVTWLDQLAAVRDLIFDPSRISSYWPEYLYQYDQIARSPVCQGTHEDNLLGIEIDRVLEINLGEVALVWASGGFYISSSQRTMTDAPDQPSASNAHSLRVRELCELVTQDNYLQNVIGNRSVNPNEARIVTSEVFPDSSIPFLDHVRLRAAN